jgi:hypothetical protein
MADSKDFPRDFNALALAIAQLTSDPHRRALAEEADRAAAHDENVRHARMRAREKPANEQS